MTTDHPLFESYGLRDMTAAHFHLIHAAHRLRTSVQAINIHAGDAVEALDVITRVDDTLTQITELLTTAEVELVNLFDHGATPFSDGFKS